MTPAERRIHGICWLLSLLLHAVLLLLQTPPTRGAWGSGRPLLYPVGLVELPGSALRQVLGQEEAGPRAQGRRVLTARRAAKKIRARGQGEKKAAVPRTPAGLGWKGPLVTPKEIADREISAEVRLKVLVGPDGRAQKVEVTEGSGYPELDRALVRLLSKLSYRPARRGAQTVAAELRLRCQVTPEETWCEGW